MMQVRLRAEAADDVRAAVAWYADRSPAAAERFLLALDEVFHAITLAPLAFQERHRGIRLVLLGRFPYSIAYRALPDLIDVVAISHHRQHPRRWRRRSD